MGADDTLCDVGGLVSRKLDFMPRCTQALEDGVPEWFTATSPDQKRLGETLASAELTPLTHDSVQVIWNRVLLKAAVFGKVADPLLSTWAGREATQDRNASDSPGAATV